MTFAAVGSSFQFTAPATLTPSGVGNFLLCEVISESAATYASALTSSNVAWSVLAGPTLCPGSSYYATVFIGQVLSTSPATLTPSYSAGTPTVMRGHAQEYSTTAGFSLVTLDVSAATGSTAGTAYPSLTPTHGSGELYYCYAVNVGTASAGTTTGYTYFVDAHSNGACWDAACTSSAQAPVWADSNVRNGVAVLLYEAPPGVPQVNDWAVDYSPLAADFNTYIRDAFNFMGSPPRLKAVQTASQTGIGAGVLTPVTFQSVVEDNYFGWSASAANGISPFTISNGWQAPVPGCYQVTLAVPLSLSSGATGDVGLSYVINGSAIGPFQLNRSEYGGNPFTWNCFDQVYLSAGDSVFPWVVCNPGGATSAADAASFEIVWISL